MLVHGVDHIEVTLNFLFWNVNNKPLARLVAVAAADNDSDVIVLAECGDPVPIVKALNRDTIRFFSFHKSLDERFVVFSRLPDLSLREIGAYDRLTFYRLIPPIGIEILLVAAHLPSKWSSSGEDQNFIVRSSSQKIIEYEEQVGHERTVLLGDLNMNPYEIGMIVADGFHATPARTIADIGSRTSRGRKFPYFYNPMWSHLGDDDGPPGTFYHQRATATELHWNLLDQVLVRPSLRPALPRRSVRVVTRIGDEQLLRGDGRVDDRIASDHLPLSFGLDLLKE